MIRGAYKFTDSFPKPVAMVRPGESGITDGLIMRMTTEGVFLDDDKKHEPLRQWDIKAWTMKSVETSSKAGLYLLRASLKDAENTKFVYILPEAEEWKVLRGLKNVKNGSQARNLHHSTLSAAEGQRILSLLGAV